MMKNKKLMIVFILVAVFLMLMVTFVKASDVSDLPTIVTDPNNTEQQGNNEPANNQPVDNNNTPNISGNTNTGANNTSNNTLPQTGVEENTVTFVFIGICIASAVYAYFKIRKYNNIH